MESLGNPRNQSAEGIWNLYVNTQTDSESHLPKSRVVASLATPQ